MDSIVTRLTVAANRSLISLDQAKSELGITDGSKDQIFAQYLARASQAIVGYCGREFARDQVKETFQLQHHHHRSHFERHHHHLHGLVLSYGFPNPSPIIDYCEIDSVLENGVALDDTDYELDQSAGILYRLAGDERIGWCGRRVAVTYTAGYSLPDDPSPTLPEEVQGAALELIKASNYNATRDPALRSENILSGLYSYSLFDPRSADSAWPVTVTGPMDRYRKISIV